MKGCAGRQQTNQRSQEVGSDGRRSLQRLNEPTDEQLNVEKTILNTEGFSGQFMCVCHRPETIKNISASVMSGHMFRWT